MRIITFPLIAMIAIVCFSCNQNNHHDNSDHNSHMMNDSTIMHTDNNMMDNDAAYACPMHHEITGAKGDKCSECGMDLTHKDGDDHAGHEH